MTNLQKKLFQMLIQISHQTPASQILNLIHHQIDQAIMKYVENQHKEVLW